MGIIAAGQITVVDLSDAPVLNTFITASRPTTQTYSKDSGTYKPSYASTPQVLTLKLTKAGSTANIIDSISSLHWFVVDGPIKTEITSKDNTANEYISGTHNEILTTKLDIDINKGSKRYEVMGIWPDPSTGLDVQFGGYIDLLLTQNGATGPQGPQGDTGNGIANTVITYGLSMSDTTEPATWSSEMPALVKGMYLWTRTVIIYTNGSSTTSYQISYIAKDADATAEIDKAKQELLEKLETVRDESLEAVDEAKQQLVTVRDESLAAAEEAKQDLTEVASDLNTAKQDLTSHAQQLQTQANAQTELSKRVTSVETTANGTRTTVSELSKTVAQNGKDITSVTARTKVVEDDLAGTKTTLSQVKTTADSTSQKTATLETGLNGLTAKFETLKIGSRNYFKNSKSRKYYIDSTETQDVRTYIDDEFWKNDTRFIKDYVRMSFDIAFNPALPSDFTTNVHFSASPWYNCGGITFKGGTTALQHFDLKFDLSGASKSYKTDNIFIRLHNTLPLNTAVSLENFNLYLSAVVEDYTQNEADIESKVAEYKQTADQNYASLQSNLQTLDGTVKQNKSEFDQTASQIKSSISSVEGKIPTNVSTRNLILKSNDFANPHKQSGDKTTVTSTNGYFVLKSTGYTANAWGGMSWNMSISEVKAGEEFSILMPVYIDSSVSLDAGLSFIIKNHSSNSAAYDYSIPTNKKDQWFNVAITFKTYKDVTLDSYPFYVCLVKNGLVRIKPPMLVRGSLIPSDYQPAFEDAESNVTKLNTTLTQTADGLKQLSTQVTSQGNTITSHTNSINSLTTGLQAKVSQSDFNTLSGRVTTAENNITAKANELSSKITSVEGKIPTNVSTRNLILKSNDFANPHKQSGDKTTVTSTNGYFVLKSTGYTANAWGGMSWNMSISEVKAGEEFSILMPVYIDSSVSLDAGLSFIIKNHSSNSAAYDYSIPTNKKDQWFNVAITFKTYKDVTLDSYPFYVCLVKNGLVRIKPPMLVRGSLIPSDYQPAFEDAESNVTKLNTTLTQTADGLKQLSTQVTSQGNTITSHTNSINSLTTGLQAKVSQSDFNTLSGRVTTAENNITAKANELSSKITSVEGKIPTNVSTRNLILKSNDFANPHKQSGDKTTVTSTNGYFVLKSTGYTANAWGGMSWNMSISEVKAGEEFSILMPVYIDSSVSLDAGLSFIIKNHSSNSAAYDYSIPTNKKDQWFNVAITFKTYKDVTLDSYPFYVCLVKNGLVRIKPPMLVRGSLIPSDYQPAIEDYDSKLAAAQSEFKQTTDSIKASVTSLDKSTVKSSSLTINSDGIVMKAGKSTTDVANAIGSYFAVNQNAIDLFADKIKVKGNMIVAGSLTADMIAGGQLRSTNGATVFNLNAGTLTFNNNSGYIQRVAGDKIFEITTHLGKDTESKDFLTSAFTIRKSDNSRRAGVQFQLYNTLDNKPTATAKLNADSLTLYDSKNTRLFSVDGRSAYLGSFNMQGWGDIPVAQIHGGLIVKDIGIGGHIKSLLKIVEELCNKTGILWA